MTAGGRRLFAALAILMLPVERGRPGAPSELPGRERERFVDPPAPRAQPGGDTISLPSTVAPAGAETDHAHDLPRRRHRRDRLQRRRPRAALRRPDGRGGLACGGLRSRPPHHREIRRRRLRAVARHRAAAEFRAARRGDPHPGGRGLCRPGDLASRKTDALPGLLHRLLRTHHGRPAGQRAHARTLPAARERPAGPEVLHHAEALADASERLDPDRRGEGEADRRDRAHRQSRHAGARAVAISRLGHAEQHRGRARGVHRHLRGHVPARGAAIRPGHLPAGAQQRGPDVLRQRELRRRPAGHRAAALARLPHAQPRSWRPASPIR